MKYEIIKEVYCGRCFVKEGGNYYSSHKFFMDINMAYENLSKYIQLGGRARSCGCVYVVKEVKE